MKHIWDTMQQNAETELVASFFVHGRGVPLQKTLIGLYRALLNSLLSYFPDHLDELTRRFEEKERQFGSWDDQKWDWNQPELQQFLYKFLLEASRSRPIIIYIDALDECGAENAQKLLEQLKQLKISAQAQNSRIKVCFSSRHYPVLGLESVPTIYIEDQNDLDIRKVIRDILQEIDPDTKKHQIENEIVSKAQGGFQWAVLVAYKAAELNRKGVNAQVIHEEIRKIPTELYQLYSDLLNIVDVSERKQMKRLFQWVLCAQRPLKIVELREALAIDTDSQFHSVSFLRTSKDYCDSLEDTERRIKDLSKGLIEVKSREVFAFTVDDESFVREVQFIHQSVPDFLAKGQQAILDTSEDSQSPIGSGHSEISRACVMYLSLAELPAAAERSWYYLISEYPLAEYAVQNLPQHISGAESERIPQVSLCQTVQRWTHDTGTFDNVSFVWSVLNDGSGSFTLWPVTNSTIWHFAAWCGAFSALGFLLQHFPAEVDVPDCLGNTPLLLAVQNGNDAVASELLCPKIHRRRPSGHVQPIANPNVTNKRGATPMSLAIERNAGNIVKLLVEAGADMKTDETRLDSSALGYTIRAQDEDLLDEIVKRSEHLDDDAPGYLLEILVPTEKQLRMLRKMLCPDTYRGSLGRMYYAVQSRQKDMIELLLEQGISPKIPKKRRDCPAAVSPLCYAIQSEDLDLVAKLVGKNVDLSGAMCCFAASHGSTERRFDGSILRELLRHGASASGSHMYEFGRILRADLVQILLESNVCPNASDDDNPLMIALERRSLEAVEVLTSSCPNLEVNHALEYMFKFEHRNGDDIVQKEEEDIIRLLLRHKNADVNQTVYAGTGCGMMRMLTAAADQGCDRITALLLEAKSVLVDCESILPPYFPYSTAPVEVKKILPSSREIKRDLRNMFEDDVEEDYVWDAAPLLMAMLSRKQHVIRRILNTGKISEASIVEAYFVAQAFSWPDIMEILKASVLPGRRLNQGGEGRQTYEIWIGPADDPDDMDLTEGP